MQQEKLTKGIFFGLIGNAAFVAFGLICLLYYYTYSDGSFFSRSIEALAYCTELAGFGLLLYADYLLIKSIRLRRLLKFSFTAYVILEALMMILEINSYKISIYQPYSLPIAIVHAVISAAACLAFLQLDPDNVKYEVAVSACIVIILAGMLGNILGIRVYFGILLNAVSFCILFGSIMFLRSREEIEIDCYGDRANEAIFNSSTLFVEEEKAEIKSDVKEEIKTDKK